MPLRSANSGTRESAATWTAAPAPTPLRCEVIAESARVRVAPAGDLDLATAPSLERTVRELLESGFDQHVVLDLAGLDFIDSTGLHLILALQSLADSYGCRFTVRPGPPVVQRIFELTGTLEPIAFEAHARPSRRVWTRR